MWSANVRVINLLHYAVPYVEVEFWCRGDVEKGHVTKLDRDSLGRMNIFSI